MTVVPEEVPLFDADGALSREFLLRRGYCCENGCRNCPYGYRKPDRAALRSSGIRVSAGRDPQRIVSLCPSNTEILGALGLMPRVVGVDDWSDWPEAVNGLPRVGPDLNVDMDRVAALGPDLVLASLAVPGMERNVVRLRERGLPHVVLDPHTLEEVWESLRTVARLTGTEARGERVVAALQGRIAAVQQRVAHLTHRPRVYWEWWPRPLFAPGARNWLTPLSELAGCRSVTGHVDAGAARPEPEEIAAADPEYIFLAWTGVAARKVRPEILLRRRGWDRITAVRKERVFVAEEGLFCRPGPRLVDGLEWMVERIHG